LIIIIAVVAEIKTPARLHSRK